MSGIEFPGKKQKFKTEAEIDILFTEWLEERECKFDEDTIEEYKRKLYYAIKKNRLSYEDSSKTFTYLLAEPIGGEKETVSIVKIRSAGIANKSQIEKEKMSTEQTMKTFNAYCTDSNGDLIKAGFLMQIEDDDQDVLTAVILGFFLKVVHVHTKSD